MGNLEKNAGNRGHIFSPIILIVVLKREQKSDWGKINDIFSPCIFIFSPLDQAIIVLQLQKRCNRGKIWQEGNQIIQCLKKLWET